MDQSNVSVGASQISNVSKDCMESVRLDRVVRGHISTVTKGVVSVTCASQVG